MQKTNIEYLDYTCNPIAMRCAPVSPGCASCWHLRTADRLKNNPALPENERKALAGTGPFVWRERELAEPLKVKKPSAIGVQFMGDLFHEDVPFKFVNMAYNIMAHSQHIFLILSKRPKHMIDWHLTVRHVVSSDGSEFWLGNNDLIVGTKSTGWPLPNVWHGLTICNQPEADAKIPTFLQVPGKKFLSLEPMLGAINLSGGYHNFLEGWDTETEAEFDQYGDRYPVPVQVQTGKIDAVILGGETGPRARPMHPDWVRSIRDQCDAAGVPFFFKQWGEYCPDDFSYVTPTGRTPKRKFIKQDGCAYDYADIGTVSMMHVKGRILDGRTHDELPWVRE
jgi:protein gp37